MLHFFISVCHGWSTPTAQKESFFYCMRMTMNPQFTVNLWARMFLLPENYPANYTANLVLELSILATTVDI